MYKIWYTNRYTNWQPCHGVYVYIYISKQINEKLIWHTNFYLKLVEHDRVARFFLVHDTKTRKMYQINTKWS
jgi:hypothetical protein